MTDYTALPDLGSGLLNDGDNEAAFDMIPTYDVAPDRPHDGQGSWADASTTARRGDINGWPPVARPGGASYGFPADEREFDPDSLLEGLNDQQRQAVVHQGDPLLIMAGAGSGKTRVLTHRIAYLLATGRARAGQILAITFTNKAAAEMRERVSQLVGDDARRMWVSTFHSACVRLLRYEHQAVGLPSSFTIYDAQDSQRLIQMILKADNVDVKRFTPKMIAARISDLKNELITPQRYADTAGKDPISRIVSQTYSQYANRLAQANAVDFDDLIMRTVQLLTENPAIAEHYHRRFRHVLVDEYQDTNHAQYMLVRALVGSGDDGVAPGELTVVGDSDQSIYAFRGATIRNIDEFERDFPGARTILLEQNYRSTQNILSAANAVIAKNVGRRPKNLWTASGDGAPIVVDTAESEHDEARFIIREIDRLHDDGTDWGDIAVFYRTNSQSRAIEEFLVRQGIPYRVVGGTRFYERREIKDALAYLQVVSNPDDTVAVRRILNTPRRGIGAKAEDALLAHADRYGLSLGGALRDAWVAAGRPAGEGEGISIDAGEREAPEHAVGTKDITHEDEVNETGREVQGLTARAAKSAANFWGLIETLRAAERAGATPADLLEEALDHTGYLAELRGSEDPQDQSRVENLAELHSVAQEFSALIAAAPAQSVTPTDADPRDQANAASATRPADEGTVGGEDADSSSPIDEDPHLGVLAAFLERVALVADSDQVPDEGQRSGQVTLMTVHTAKGLEFPVVFVTGMEDGTFPHQRSLGEAEELEEERRLAYVAITRARKRLYLTRAVVRSAWGTPQEMPPSRFLDDIPSELISMRRDGPSWTKRRSGYSSAGYSSGARSLGKDPWGDADSGPVFGSGRGRSGDLGSGNSQSPRVGAGRPIVRFGRSTPAAKAAQEDTPMLVLAAGDRVRHETLGTGVVLGVEGQGRQTVARVQFGTKEKRLLVRLAPMEKL
ncbi:UvrD-helicase domain-containing protein [Schaalia sp. ZJ405]|uniref:ATP-dependent helicase n=1 Tax=Schaalia sp. ZJ405 TaxID=2709403 RepID=UPI0013EDD939|nr:UvrD-helicase domain-containing protein [Schaalia sp. ZJ405]QPK81626.1 UvrD-helicase domain-containing protein [Schaalia sp. ZJ405]